MPKIHTHYDNLKISRTAPPEVVKAAYKTLVQKYHPDRNQDNPRATEILKVINEAFEVLSDPIKREQHDRWIYEQERLINQNVNEQSAPSSTHVNQSQSTGYQYAKQTSVQSTERESNVVRNVVFIAVIGAFIFGFNHESIENFLSPNGSTSSITHASSNEAAYEEPVMPPEEPAIPPQPLPNTGDTNNPSLTGGAPLHVKTSYGDDHYWLKVVDYSTDQEIASYFIRGGDTLDVMLPAGTYKIRYASGKNWYGVDALFGADTAYAEAQDVFTFSFNGYSYSGYTIELIQQVNGNLQTAALDSSQF